jgi:exopolyphosphatase / guanosine-5'-triphosphate,3'-diphosphate pyrophosphatase
MRTAIIDAGSISARLNVIDLSPGQPITISVSKKFPTRLGESLGKGGRIRQPGLDRLVGAVAAAADTAREHDAEELLAFATAAVRDAANRDEAVERVAAETGVRLAFLTGQDEARLTFLAARAWLGWSKGPLLLADIGGGTLELASGAGAEPDCALSLPLGAAQLTRARLADAGDPPDREHVKRLRRQVALELAAEVSARFTAPRRPYAVATSRIFAHLAKLAGSRTPSGGRILSREAIRQQIPRLAAMDTDARVRINGIPPSRAGQILAGAIVAEAVMNVLSIPYVHICPWALREGIALRRLAQLSTQIAKTDDISHLLQALPDHSATLAAAP